MNPGESLSGCREISHHCALHGHNRLLQYSPPKPPGGSDCPSTALSTTAVLLKSPHPSPGPPVPSRIPTIPRPARARFPTGLCCGVLRLCGAAVAVAVDSRIRPFRTYDSPRPTILGGGHPDENRLDFYVQLFSLCHYRRCCMRHNPLPQAFYFPFFGPSRNSPSSLKSILPLRQVVIAAGISHAAVAVSAASFATLSSLYKSPTGHRRWPITGRNFPSFQASRSFQVSFPTEFSSHMSSSSHPLIQPTAGACSMTENCSETRLCHVAAG